MTDDQTQRDENRPDGSKSEGELLGQIADREARIQIKSRLIDNMIYQIRTLANAIIGFSDLLSSEELTVVQTEYTQEIHHAGYGLSALVNEVLDWTQVLSGELELKKTHCELADIIRHIEDILSNATKEKGLDYQVVTDPMLPNGIVTDDERLQRCLLNVIANAVQYTPQGSVRLHVLLEESVFGSMVRFDIIDSGIGIDENKIARLFEPYDYQVNSVQGLLAQLDMGLQVTAGLPLTKLLTEFLGGTVEVKSQVGAGSTFSLRVPVGTMCQLKQSEPGGVQTSANPVDRDDCQSIESPAGTILLVEDQPANRTVISLMLEALGVEVETAVDGEEALKKVEYNSYSLILMDLKMPKMDGYEATRRIREKGIEIPIAALSAKVLNGDERSQVTDMFDGFITKPVDSRKLSEILQKFIGGFSAPDRNVPSSEQDTVASEYGN